MTYKSLVPSSKGHYLAAVDTAANRARRQSGFPTFISCQRQDAHVLPKRRQSYQGDKLCDVSTVPLVARWPVFLARGSDADGEPHCIMGCYTLPASFPIHCCCKQDASDATLMQSFKHEFCRTFCKSSSSRKTTWDKEGDNTTALRDNPCQPTDRQVPPSKRPTGENNS